MASKLSSAETTGNARRATRIPGSGTFRTHRGVVPLSPVVIAIGARVPCDGMVSAGATIVRADTASAAASRVLSDRNAVAVVVVQPTYAAVDDLIRAVRESAQRLPAIVACTSDDWPDDSPWAPSRRVHPLTCGGAFAAEATALVSSFVGVALERFARIERYSEAHRLSDLESDVVWHRVRGVPYDRLEDAQGCGYETKKKRLSSIREKTDHEDIDDAMREALGTF